MNESAKILVVDAGNTVIKLGLFVGKEFVQSHKFSTQEFLADGGVVKIPEHNHCILSSVLSDEDESKLLTIIPNARVLDSALILPLQNEYKTPETLGKDRLSAAVGAYALAKTETVVVIDIGTCIKFDVVEKGKYLGGSISPGMRLRFKALHQFTGKLPLLEFETNSSLIGHDTKGSILSGVVQGIQSEIQGFIDRYENKYRRLTFFVTGGDAKYFELEAKNDIFANENLTLIGLYEIYKVNVQ